MKGVTSLALVMALVPMVARAQNNTIPTEEGPITFTAIQHASVQVEWSGRVIQVDPAQGDFSKAKLADMVIVTDDNPRSENPAVIRKEILATVPKAREIGDRAEAIRAGIAALQVGDVLVLAGKGHETGQYVGSEVRPFSDREEAVKAALALGGRAA